MGDVTVVNTLTIRSMGWERLSGEMVGNMWASGSRENSMEGECIIIPNARRERVSGLMAEECDGPTVKTMVKAAMRKFDYYEARRNLEGACLLPDHIKCESSRNF
eukprot:TRINITY_DN11832_c0_g1_i1.p3 TRINITY_DN11832_c0_g1~~TRINITY_DN11832_c0_g1_i1.p3  ORF type:complete len:105 (-),score=4.79 TRINITY_DN11832_c0_g1_i1:307-621(-)